MTADFPIIDAHALLGAENHLSLEADELLRRMDAHGIELAVARPMGAELAVTNTEGNDRVLKAHPRIRGLITVNPWYGPKAIEELKRCRDAGAVGLFLHPSRQGFMPTDAVVPPVLDWAETAGWPVVMHTGTYVESDVLALQEIARARPAVNFVAGFGGFTDMWFELPGVLAATANIFLDASMIWGQAALRAISEIGPGRVLFGSAEPRGRYGAAIRKAERMELPAEHLHAFMRDNAARLFRLP